MSDAVISQYETLLLRAALHPVIDSAVAAWKSWAAARVLEEAPYPELRMLPAVYGRLGQAAPGLALPEKLRGKARATFTRNQLLAHGSLSALQALAAEMPVMLVKGAALCARFNNWSSRAMGDIDVLVPIDRLEAAGEILAAGGWIPKYGMTWASLNHRTSLRRNSWNIARGNADVDIHWRFLDEASGAALDRELWGSADTATFFGVKVCVPSPEFAVVIALRHGFLEGTHGDRLQTALDVSAYLPLCNRTALADLIAAAGLSEAYDQLQSIFALTDPSLTFALAPAVSHSVGPKASLPDAIAPLVMFERALLRRPRLYRIWEQLGRKALLERWLIRHFGPFSKPLGFADRSRSDFDLRECSVIDDIAGPGWGWPEPEHTCFWSDCADCRLLLPLEAMRDHVVILTVGSNRLHSPNGRVHVFANGRLVDIITLGARGGPTSADYAFTISRDLLFGPWVELSFRPDSYKGDLRSSLNYADRRSIPASRIRVLDMVRLGAALGSSDLSRIGLKLLADEEPHASKLARIKEKMARSPYKDAADLPQDFDPIAYVTWYLDLLDAEVDPYEHFLLAGRSEGRSWR